MFPVFIIGSGRSGNTLLRRLMLATGEIYIPPETYEMAEIIRTWPRLFLLPWKQRVWLFCAFFERHPHFATFGLRDLGEFAALAEALPRERRTLRGLFEAFYLYLGEKSGRPATRWGDKTPFNTFGLRQIARTFPDARFSYIYRDGLDVVASYVRAGLYPDVVQAAWRWTRANRLCDELGRREPDRVRRLRYEDMVGAPQRHLPSLFGWLSLSYTDDVLQRDPGHLGDTEFFAHHDGIRSEISPRSVGRWRSAIGPRELESLPREFWQTMERLGYAPSPGSAMSGAS